jgi:hypothetical protein
MKDPVLLQCVHNVCLECARKQHKLNRRLSQHFESTAYYCEEHNVYTPLPQGDFAKLPRNETLRMTIDKWKQSQETFCPKHKKPFTCVKADDFEPVCQDCLKSSPGKTVNFEAATEKAFKMLKSQRDRAAKLMSKYEQEAANVLERKADACEHLLQVIQTLKQEIDKLYDQQLSSINDQAEQALAELETRSEALSYTLASFDSTLQQLRTEDFAHQSKKINQLLEFEVPLAASTFNIFTQDHLETVIEALPDLFTCQLHEILLSPHVLFSFVEGETTAFGFDLTSHSYHRFIACDGVVWPKDPAWVSLGEGLLLVVGGRRQGELIKETLLFNLADQAVVRLNDMMFTHDPLSLISYDQCVYALSGKHNEVLLVQDDCWEELPSLDVDRMSYALRWLDNIYCTAVRGSRSKVYLFSIKQQAWASLDVLLPEPRTEFCCFAGTKQIIFLGTGYRRMYVVEGRNSVEYKTEPSLTMKQSPVLYQQRLYFSQGNCETACLELKSMNWVVFSAEEE